MTTEAKTSPGKTAARRRAAFVEGANERVTLVGVATKPLAGLERAYGAEGLRFGPEYLIPKPFDPRLIDKIGRAHV